MVTPILLWLDWVSTAANRVPKWPPPWRHFTCAAGRNAVPWRQTAPDAGTATARLSGSQRGLEGRWWWRQPTVDCENVSHHVGIQTAGTWWVPEHTCICAWCIATNCMTVSENIWLLLLMWWSWIMQSVSTWLVGPTSIPRACGLVNCLLTVSLYIYSTSCQNSYSLHEETLNSIAETFWIRLQGCGNGFDR